METLFQSDLYGWALQQADALRRRSSNELDWDHLAQEFEALGRREARELYSRFLVLNTHLLKWIYQPERRGKSLRLTIMEQRRALARHLADNPSLKAQEAQEFTSAYEFARERAAVESELPLETFPAAPPFSIEEARDSGWWPAEP